MEYRRANTAGASYFFTLVTYHRQPVFAEEKEVMVLRQAFKAVMNKYPFVIDAIVVMPDHLHCIWELPQGDADFSTRWRLIKMGFTKHCDERWRQLPDRSRKRKKQQAVWQHRYWEHLLRDEADYHHHVDYIHYNPVKHGYVKTPSD